MSKFGAVHLSRSCDFGTTGFTVKQSSDAKRCSYDFSLYVMVFGKCIYIWILFANSNALYLELYMRLFFMWYIHIKACIIMKLVDFFRLKTGTFCHFTLIIYALCFELASISVPSSITMSYIHWILYQTDLVRGHASSYTSRSRPQSLRQATSLQFYHAYSILKDIWNFVYHNSHTHLMNINIFCCEIIVYESKRMYENYGIFCGTSIKLFMPWWLLLK